MNIPNISEVSLKEKRIYEYMQKNGYEAVIIGRHDNFAWLTCGGDNRVLITSEAGACIIVITKENKYIIANTMDGERIINEEMSGMDYELVNLKWYQKPMTEKVTELAKGLRTISDTYLPEVDFRPGEFYGLHYPLTDNEIQKYRWLGRKAEEIIRKVSDEIKPGMSEKEIEAMLICEYAENDIIEAVGIIGSDERISRYRHCTASFKKVDKLVMLAPAIQKWGLTLPMTRMIYFGDKLPGELAGKYEAVCNKEYKVNNKSYQLPRVLLK